MSSCTAPQIGVPAGWPEPAAGGRLRPPVPVRVLVCEDNLLVREGLRSLLELRDGIEVVGTCGDADSITAAMSTDPPDVLITDIRMPPGFGDEGIRIANALRTTAPELGVVVVSEHADPSYALALLEHGSNGRAYLLKERIHR